MDGTFTPLTPNPLTWTNVIAALAREIKWYRDPSRCLYGVLPFIANVEAFIAKTPVNSPGAALAREIAKIELAKLKELTA